MSDDSFDLYDCLGLQRDATQSQIKQQYRKLAFQCHPDKNKTPEAKIQFRKISEAYDILSQPQKRKAYDSLGYQAVSSEMPIVNAVQLFRSLFNVDFTREMDTNLFYYSDTNYSGEIPDNNDNYMYHDISCTLEELYFGCQKEFQIGVRDKQMRHNYTSYVLNIRPGTTTEECLLIKNAGGYNPISQATRDLIVRLQELPHEYYKRQQNDLYREYTISLTEALCGFHIKLEHFNESLSIEYTNIVKPNSLLQVFHKGMPIKQQTQKQLGDSGDSDFPEYGNLILDLKICFPETIEKSHQTQLSQIFNQAIRVDETSSSEKLLPAYYFKNKEDVVKELLTEEEESSTGCLQQ